jgi:N-methylhydantoinase A
MPARPPLRIAIDSGGTFTDCVWLEGSRLRILKVFSTANDPSRAITGAVAQVAPSGAVLTILHGTTVGTNTLLQRRGARAAFVTTAGFEDSIEIGRQNRPKLYDFFFEKDPPLASAELRFGVDERTSAEGEILHKPGPAALANLVDRIALQEPQAVAVSLLFSFANSANEQAVATALRRLGVPISLSHKILPEFREYERASTVLVNAYLQPTMEKYLHGLKKNMTEGNRARIFVMQSSGGITALETAAEQPVRTVLSGPAGGVIGASALARRSGFAHIISFDMGGTSTDVALVQGAVSTTNEAEVAGLPVRVPILDIHTVGAGGGSLARFDAGGALRVGPESAGADPGPVCYGRGNLPTVTDANLLLGRLATDQFLGGEFKLDLPRTQSIVREWLKESGSRLSLEEFAAGMVRVVNANMEKAIRVVSIERGYDPRGFALVAFGGAGGLHAGELAQALRIPRVIVPACPGGLSALGILISDVVKDNSRTVLLRASQLPEKELNRLYVELQRGLSAELNQEAWKGRAVFEKSCDLRYRGQGYELNLGFGRDLFQRFHAEHHRRYGYSSAQREVEIVTVRLRARVPSPEKLTNMKNVMMGKPIKLETSFAPVWFSGKKHKTPIRARESLSLGKSYLGPAIITEYSATTAVPPRWTFQIDRAANLILTM